MNRSTIDSLERINRTLRYLILTMTSQAGFGYLTSSLSSVELVSTVFYGGYFKYDLDDPDNDQNDRIIFSKAHASALFYALWALSENAGTSETKSGIERVTVEELVRYQKAQSRLGSYPTMSFPYTEVATGMLGQGLSVGLGLALNAKKFIDQSYQTYVLLGDSELTEGMVWEAVTVADHYNLDNLVALIDINRLGQFSETVHGHQAELYKKKLEAFGWDTTIVQGHSVSSVHSALKKAKSSKRPFALLAKTIKGKGISFLENQIRRHGQVLDQEELQQALLELGSVDTSARGSVKKPSLRRFKTKQETLDLQTVSYGATQLISTGQAVGQALVTVGQDLSELVVLDSDMANSTNADLFAVAYPERFLQMFMAEQNMLAASVGLARRRRVPVVVTLAAFVNRMAEQLKLISQSQVGVKVVGSHGGFPSGSSGAVHMSLRDLALIRTLPNWTVLYPSDAVSAAALLKTATVHKGPVYLRTTEHPVPVIYKKNHRHFKPGGSCTLKRSGSDQVTVVAVGLCVNEALAAYDKLSSEGIAIRVIDCYSLQPLDRSALRRAARETKAIVTVEDHHPVGGLGDTVGGFLQSENLSVPVRKLGLYKDLNFGQTKQLMVEGKIDSQAIQEAVRSLLS